MNFLRERDVTIKRDYQNADNAVKNHYLKLRTKQNLDYVKKMHQKYHKFDKKLSIHECFKSLDNFIDVSDPDINLPNLHHLLQTAEAIRKDGLPDWFQLVGLIHDLGKLIYLKGCDEDGTSVKEQWGIVGDTFIVGCPLPGNIVYPEFNKYNQDYNKYNYNYNKYDFNQYEDSNKYGVYKKHCGLDNCFVSYGHDEYMYQVLKYNQTKLPEKALYIIRYHSLYPWHKYNEYEILMDEKDKEYKKYVQEFNKYDLYSKENLETDVKELMKYYEPIIEKYIGNELFI